MFLALRVYMDTCIGQKDDYKCRRSCKMHPSFLSYSGTLITGTARLPPLLSTPLPIHVCRLLLINPIPSWLWSLTNILLHSSVQLSSKGVFGNRLLVTYERFSLETVSRVGGKVKQHDFISNKFALRKG